MNGNAAYLEKFFQLSVSGSLQRRGGADLTRSTPGTRSAKRKAGVRFSEHLGPKPRQYLDNRQSIPILEAAREVFVREGPAAFSARRVAKAAGLSLGSVQHVFATTNQLVTAMIEHVNDGYEAAYRKMAEQLPFSAEERLKAMIDYLIADICRADVRKFWFGFWSLSCHNPEGQALLREAYRWQCNNIAGFIGAAKPQRADSDCLRLATHITALIEGMMLFTGMSEKTLDPQSRLLVDLRQQVWSMIDNSKEFPDGRSEAKRRRSA